MTECAWCGKPIENNWTNCHGLDTHTHCKWRMENAVFQWVAKNARKEIKNWGETW